MNQTCQDAYGIYLQHKASFSSSKKVAAICNLLVKLERRCVDLKRNLSYWQLMMIYDIFDVFLSEEKIEEEDQLKLMCHVVGLPIGSYASTDVNFRDMIGFIRS